MGRLQHLRQQRTELGRLQAGAASPLPFEMASDYPPSTHMRALGHMAHRYQVVRVLWVKWAKSRGISIWHMVTAHDVLQFLRSLALWVLEHVLGSYIPVADAPAMTTTLSPATDTRSEEPVQIGAGTRKTWAEQASEARSRKLRNDSAESMRTTHRVRLHLCASPPPPPEQQVPTAAGSRALRKRPRPRSPQNCGSTLRAQAKRRQSGLHIGATQTEALRSRGRSAHETAKDIAVAQIPPTAHCEAHEATSLHRRRRTATGAAKATPPGKATATGTTLQKAPPTAPMCTYDFMKSPDPKIIVAADAKKPTETVAARAFSLAESNFWLRNLKIRDYEALFARTIEDTNHPHLFNHDTPLGTAPKSRKRSITSQKATIWPFFAIFSSENTFYLVPRGCGSIKGVPWNHLTISKT